ncbi:MAG: GAF domain-containing protein [Anaerolineales bacterium]|jgi:PAS domain S-box-containing protein
MNAETKTPERTDASLELLYSISRELAAQIDLAKLLKRILQLTAEKLGAASGGILVIDEEGVATEGALLYEGAVRGHTAAQQADTLRGGLAGWVLQNRKPALVINTHKDPRWMRRDGKHIDSLSRSAISVPLIAQDRIVGVLTLVHPQEGHYNEAHLDLLGAIADQAGMAVEKARLFAAEQERRRQALILQEIARTINSVLDPAMVFDKILGQLARLVDYDKASIMLIDNELLQLVAARGFENAASLIGREISVDPETEIGKMLSSGIPMVVEDAQETPGWFDLEEMPELRDVHGWIGTPLVIRKSSVGVLNVCSHTRGAYDQADLDVVAAFAVHATTGVANAQLFSETQAASQLYAGLFEDSIDSILITNTQGVITDANNRAEYFLGYKRDALFDRSINSLHTSRPEEIPEDLTRLKPSETKSYTTAMIAASGEELPVEVYVKRIDVARQPFLQWILRDISERLELDELRDDLTSMIFHDLRSPLANVISSLEVLQASVAPDGETLQSVLAIAMRSSRRLSRLVDSLLDLARLNAGKDILDKADASLEAIIDEAIEEVQPVANAKSHTINVALSKHLPEIVFDVDMIRRVMINLIENAIKFTPSGGKIEVRAKHIDKDVVVSVIDTGPGISEDEHQEIFEKFARGKHVDRPKGLGLGLSFCKLAIEAHGGRIWVDSEPGKGSTFSFSLPI